MTQKELLYVEDAVKHEQSMICFIQNCIANSEEKPLISFWKNELSKHESFEKKLLHLLEVKANE